MYRVIAIVSWALALAACSTMGGIFTMSPQMDTIRFESQPPGAEAKTSTGQSCRTPCALAMPASKPFSVTFALNGYHSGNAQVEMTEMEGGASKLQPNPVTAELTPEAAQVPKPTKKPVRRVRARKKPAAHPAPTAAAPPTAPATAEEPTAPADTAAPAAPAAPPPMPAGPAQQQAPLPWPQNGAPAGTATPPPQQ